MVKHAKKTITTAAIPLYVLSDSTGNLAKHMVTSFLTQFPDGAFDLKLRPFIGEQKRLDKSLAEISTHPGIVFHAVVSPSLKSDISLRCQDLQNPCCDLTGPTVDFLAHASRIKPLSDQQRLHQVDHVYCDRINAMAFTLEHDDGLGLPTLGQSDVVIIGVSRTGKTPTSIYLAMQGYRTANVSLATGIEVPAQLFELPRGKAIGFIIDPHQLAEIRTRRQSAWRMTPTDYNDPNKVEEEIQWCRRVFAKLHCPVLDVTDQAIEETAARALDILGLAQPGRREMAELS